MHLQHPLAVVGLLTHLKTDVAAIVAGLLHDTLEDTLATPAELEQRFGKMWSTWWTASRRSEKLPSGATRKKQAENFRKMVLSMADDIRVVLIKLADRLHNMRTLEYLSERKRHEIAQETLEILRLRWRIGWGSVGSRTNSRTSVSSI
ncbi:MAG: HD domain-containing protein [Nitrospiraceae bacterium]